MKERQILFHHPTSHTHLWPDFPQGPSFSTSAARMRPSPCIPQTPWAAQGPQPSVASKALQGHVLKPSMWLPISMPPLSLALAFWHALPLKTQVLSSVSQLPGSDSQGVPMVRSARGAAKAQKELGPLCGMPTQRSAACVCPWGTPLLSPQLWTGVSENENSKTQL